MTSRLNDNEVSQEMEKMLSFIKQEAKEKVREITIKADEEFNIEKGKLIRMETLQIEELFERKLKQQEIQRKIQASHLVNKNRLRVLQKREELLNQVFASIDLSSVTKNTENYQNLLQKLILQSFYSLMEPKVRIRIRPEDKEIVIKPLEAAKNEFAKIMQVECVIEEEPLSCHGGVLVGSNDWNIKCMNTLDQRLDILKEMVFGPNVDVTTNQN